MPLYRLGPVEYGFPPASAALDEPNGLLAVGGDLSPERLLQAYRHGIFPWFNPGDPICWWSPDPRCVFHPADWRPSRSLAKRLRGEQLRIILSIIVVVATDVPLLPHQLKRIAKRVPLGIARTGGMGNNYSGDIFVAFSTATIGEEHAATRAELAGTGVNILNVCPGFVATNFSANAVRGRVIVQPEFDLRLIPFTQGEGELGEFLADPPGDIGQMIAQYNFRGPDANMVGGATL